MMVPGAQVWASTRAEGKVAKGPISPSAYSPSTNADKSFPEPITPERELSPEGEGYGAPTWYTDYNEAMNPPNNPKKDRRPADESYGGEEASWNVNFYYHPHEGKK